MNIFPRVLIALPFLATFDVHAETFPFDSDRWQINAEQSSLENHLGRQSLKLLGGMAWLPGVEFTDGTITFDMSFSNAPAFSGVTWRMQDENNYEHFYLRPHRSGQPDANQYTPVFNGVSGWQLYYGERYSAVANYPYDEWIAVKLLVSDSQAEVYIGDLEHPVFFIPELKREPKPGAVGVDSSNFSPIWFSNFRVDDSPVELTTQPELPAETMEPNMVDSWQFSNTFAATTLDDKLVLDDNFKQSLTWTSLAIEPPGFANIARLRTLGEAADTVMARLVIESPIEQAVFLEFGYSDLARVFLNDRLVYEGDNSYQSRDFRFLGTIGLFDGLSLPLVSGTNELWIAVTEQFGGWGVTARLKDATSVEVLGPKRMRRIN